MPWTGSFISATKNPDGLTLTVTYSVTDGVTTEQITEPRVPGTQAAIAVVEDAVRYRNRVLDQKSDVAGLDPTKVVGPVDDVKAVLFPPVDPDPDQVARTQFQKALSDYRIARIGEALGLTMAPDSATILSGIQTTWLNLSDIQQDLYKPLLVAADIL